MIVISDTTPIISLLKAGHLDLLNRLFGEVVIPEAVYMELTGNKSFQAEAKTVEQCTFIQVARVRDQKSVNIFRKVTGLDAGESESIVMAEEANADLLLMDEHKGRRVARQMGLTITGTIGILISAYDEGYLSGSDVEICIERLKEHGIRISDALYENVRNHIGK